MYKYIYTYDCAWEFISCDTKIRRASIPSVPKFWCHPTADRIHPPLWPVESSLQPHCTFYSLNFTTIAYPACLMEVFIEVSHGSPHDLGTHPSSIFNQRDYETPSIYLPTYTVCVLSSLLLLAAPHLLVGISCHDVLTIPRDAICCSHVLAGKAHRQQARLELWGNWDPNEIPKKHGDLDCKMPWPFGSNLSIRVVQNILGELGDVNGGHHREPQLGGHTVFQRNQLWLQLNMWTKEIPTRKSSNAHACWSFS